MLYRSMGKRVRQQRLNARMTQERLAEEAGISLSFLGHIERGTRKASLDTLVRICNALRVSPRLLLQDSLEDDLLGDGKSIPDTQRRLLREISDKLIQYGVEFRDEED